MNGTVDIFALSDGLILTHNEAAKSIRVSDSKLYALQARGDIKPIRLDTQSKRKGFTAGELKRYLRDINGGSITGVEGVDNAL